MSEREDELLNRFLDGELSESDRPEYERYASQNPEFAEMRDDFSAIGEMLRAHVDAEETAMDFSGFAANIDHRLNQEPAPTAAFGVDERETRIVEPQPPSSFGDQIRSWWQQFSTPLLIGAGAAAAIMFFVMRADTPVEPQGAQMASSATAEVVVEAISNEGKKTVLVSMPGEKDESTVIWLLDDEDDDQAPTEGEDPI
jgi:anti-sigma factor RsiW